MRRNASFSLPFLVFSPSKARVFLLQKDWVFITDVAMSGGQDGDAEHTVYKVIALNPVEHRDLTTTAPARSKLSSPLSRYKVVAITSVNRTTLLQYCGPVESANNPGAVLVKPNCCYLLDTARKQVRTLLLGTTRCCYPVLLCVFAGG